MRHAIRLSIMATMLIGICSACATKALIKAAGVSSQAKSLGMTQLVSAYRDGDMANLCIHRTAPGASVETYQVRVPIAETRNFYFSASDEQALVVKMTNEQIRYGVCKTDGEPIAIVEITNQEQLKLGSSQKDVFYVKYAKGSLQNMGYASTSPFRDSSNTSLARYSYAIDFSETDILARPGPKRLYLLILLPVTVVADATIGVGAGVFFIGYAAVAGCSQTPGGCRGGF